MPGKTVLIADDDALFAESLRRRCETLGVEARTASDGLDALIGVMRDAPDLLILDVNMPAADGFGVAEKLLGDARMRQLPVIFCTGHADADTVARCEALGAHVVDKSGDSWSKLKPIICTALDVADDAAAAAPARPPRVLFVDDDENLRRFVQVILHAYGLEVVTAQTAVQALRLAVAQTPDVIITDHHMPEGSGEYLMGRLRAVPALKAIPIIVLTAARVDGRRDLALERRFLGEYGVSAFLSKPINPEALLDALSRHVAVDEDVRRQVAMLRGR